MNSVLDVCRYVINYSNEMEYGISNLKLQKILYFIQAYFFIIKDEPCFTEKIEAWDFGPVVPDAYYEYREFGSSDIPHIESYIAFVKRNGFYKFERKFFSMDVISHEDRKLINCIVDKFKDYSANDLVRITHKQTPWKVAYAKGRNSEITNKAIRSFFNDKR